MMNGPISTFGTYLRHRRGSGAPGMASSQRDRLGKMVSN
jgi:hypothetical protein